MVVIVRWLPYAGKSSCVSGNWKQVVVIVRWLPLKGKYSCVSGNMVVKWLLLYGDG